MRRKRRRKSSDNKITVEDFLEDVFGLNVRGLMTLRITFQNPRLYFRAAKSKSWQDTFSPSIRLWFSITALTFFFKFLWADADAATVQAMVQSMQSQGINLPEGVTYEAAALTLSRWWFAYLPFTTLASMLALGFLWPFWGMKTTAPLRIRYVFAVIVPSATVTFFTTLGMAWLSADWFLPYYLSVIALVILVDALTSWRGLFVREAPRMRLIRAGSLGLATGITALAASFAAQLIGLLTIDWLYLR